MKLYRRNISLYAAGRQTEFLFQFIVDHVLSFRENQLSERLVIILPDWYVLLDTSKI